MTTHLLRNLFWVLMLSLTVASAQTQKDGWWQKFLRVTGISATPSKQRDSFPTVQSGYVMIGDLGETNSQSQPLTKEAGYRSPIFVDKDQNILALKNDEVVRIPVSGGQPRTLFTIKGAVKLIGESLDDPNSVLMLTADIDKKTIIALLSLTSGTLTPIPYETGTTEGETMFAHLAGWNRVYCNTTVSVAESVKKDPASGRITVKWTDVYLKRAYRDPINVSNCNGVNCGQPSLSQDGSLVSFIKAER